MIHMIMKLLVDTIVICVHICSMSVCNRATGYCDFEVSGS